MSAIYAIHSALTPEAGIVYVGSTIHTGAERLQGHLRLAAHDGTAPLSAWIREHGAQHVRVTEIDWYYGENERELLALEVKWLRFFRRSGKVLLNVNLPLRVYEDRSRPPVALRAPAELPVGFAI